MPQPSDIEIADKLLKEHPSQWHDEEDGRKLHKLLALYKENTWDMAGSKNKYPELYEQLAKAKLVYAQEIAAIKLGNPRAIAISKDVADLEWQTLRAARENRLQEFSHERIKLEQLKMDSMHGGTQKAHVVESPSSVG